MQEMHIGTKPSLTIGLDELTMSCELVEQRSKRRMTVEIERRVLRRQIQKDALDHLDKSFLLYGRSIDDSV